MNSEFAWTVACSAQVVAPLHETRVTILDIPHSALEITVCLNNNTERGREQHAVHPVQDSAVAGDDRARVLDARRALQQRFGQVADGARRLPGARLMSTTSTLPTAGMNQTLQMQRHARSACQAHPESLRCFSSGSPSRRGGASRRACRRNRPRCQWPRSRRTGKPATVCRQTPSRTAT